MNGEENKKEAVNIGVTLSTQLISTSLAMVAVLGAFATFIIDKREVNWYYYILTGTSFVIFILSIFFGGKGIDKARKNGFDGNWNLVDTKSSFNLQAIFCVLGLIFFIISIFIGREKSSTEVNPLTTIDRNVYDVQFIDSLQQNEINNLKKEIKQLNKQLGKLKLQAKSDTIISK